MATDFLPAGDGWRPIAEAPRDGQLYDLASLYVPSDEAYRNGARAHWQYGEGSRLRSGSDIWTGGAGHHPDAWRPLSGDFEVTP